MKIRKVEVIQIETPRYYQTLPGTPAGSPGT